MTDEMTRDMPFELVDETIELVIQYLGKVMLHNAVGPCVLMVSSF